MAEKELTQEEIREKLCAIVEGTVCGARCEVALYPRPCLPL